MTKKLTELVTRLFFAYPVSPLQHSPDTSLIFFFLHILPFPWLNEMSWEMLVWCYSVYTESTRLQFHFQRRSTLRFFLEEKFNLHLLTNGPTSGIEWKRKCHY